MLAVSGTLNSKTGGPSVIVPIDKTLVNVLNKPSVNGRRRRDHRGIYRRSIYLIYKRNLRVAVHGGVRCAGTR